MLTPAMCTGTVLAAFALARTAGRTQLEATVMRRAKLRKADALPERRGFLAMPAARLMAGVPATGLIDVAGFNQTELRGVVVGVVARHEEVLRARRLKRDQQPCFLATHGQAMRHVLRERRVGPGFHLDLLVADVRSDRALEDIERLIFARVDMDPRFVARPHPPSHPRPAPPRP